MLNQQLLSISNLIYIVARHQKSKSNNMAKAITLHRQLKFFLILRIHYVAKNLWKTLEPWASIVPTAQLLVHFPRQAWYVFKNGLFVVVITAMESNTLTLARYRKLFTLLKQLRSSRLESIVKFDSRAPQLYITAQSPVIIWTGLRALASVASREVA